MNRPLIQLLLPALCGALISVCAFADLRGQVAPKVAFLADVHLLDVYRGQGALEGSVYPEDAGLLRTMEAQSRSTRLFNENYFALLAALNELVRRDIRLVALPGDFSDDGQPVNIEGLNRILEFYERRHGLRFFAVTGNHDPTRPFGRPGGKTDFLDLDGNRQARISEAPDGVGDSAADGSYQVDPELREWGYAEIMQTLGQHGFYPRKDYLYWATPFSPYSYEQFSPELAMEHAGLDSRVFAPDSLTPLVPDASYVVEPVEGLWLLALDANVYPYRGEQQGGFGGTGIGYREVLTHKPWLVDWVRLVMAEARRLGKGLLAFSHYPMVDYNDGATPELLELFGPDRFQAARIPPVEVAAVFAETGLGVHVGGHMHYNDTGIYRAPEGGSLLNIQAPSLASYPPAFKVLELRSSDTLRVETVVLDRVPGFDTFFGRYREEYAVHGEPVPWDRDILASPDYRAFALAHLRNLVELRFIPSDWPQEAVKPLTGLNGLQLLTLACAGDEHGAIDPAPPPSDRAGRRNWRRAHAAALSILRNQGEDASSWELWTGKEWIIAFHQLRNAESLALRDIEPVRLDQYRLLASTFLSTPGGDSIGLLRVFSSLFLKQLQAEPSSNFTWVISRGQLIPDEPQESQH